MSPERDFLGIGWSTTVHLDDQGGDDGQGAVALSAFEENVRQSILTILSTAPGERQMRPDFGCDIQTLVFAANDATTAGLAAFFVEKALRRWEPRIDVLQVTARPDDGRDGTAGRTPERPSRKIDPWRLRPRPEDRRDATSSRAPDRLLVEIAYRVIATNTVFNLVYPFYLTEGAGG